MMNPPSKDIADMLAAADLGLTLATNLFISEMLDKPDECVAVTDTGGRDPNYILNDATKDYRRPTAQILIRGKKGEYAEAYTLADSCRDVISGLHNQTLGGSWYVEILTQGDIMFLGYDDNHRPILSVNFRIERRDA
jgi:hypothetical protein